MLERFEDTVKVQTRGRPVIDRLELRGPDGARADVDAIAPSNLSENERRILWQLAAASK